MPNIVAVVLRGWVAFISALGLYAYLHNSHFAWFPKVILALVAFGLLGIAHRLRSEENEGTWNTAGMYLWGASTLATFLWAWHFDSVQISDFGVYFRCGSEISSNIAKWVDDCQSQYLHKNLIYWTRSLLYTAPIEFLAGADYTILKLWNAGLHSATIALWYVGLRHYYGPRTATIATGFLVFYPEWWFTLTLATTDNVILLFVVAFTLLLPQLQRRPHGALIIISLSLSVILFAANMLRTIGSLLLLTAIVWSVSQRSMRSKAYDVLWLMAVSLIYVLLSSTIEYVSPASASGHLQFLKVLSSIDFSTLQSFGSNYPWVEHFWFSVPEEWRTTIAFEKIYLEMVNGFHQWPLYLYQKASLVFDGSGYYRLSSSLYAGFNPDTVYTVPESTVPFSLTVESWLAAVGAMYLVLALATIFRTPLSAPAFIALIWTGVFALMILGLSEAQPRYTVLLAPALSLLCALAVCGPVEAKSLQPVGSWTNSPFSPFLGLLFIAVLFGILLLGLNIARRIHHNPILFASKIDPGAPHCNSQSATLEVNYKQLRIFMPKGTNCAAVNLPVSREVQKISFFVSGSRFPYLWEPPTPSSFQYKIKIREQSILEQSLGEKSVRWHLIELNDLVLDAITQVSFFFDRKDSDTDDSIDVSLFMEIRS
jgi:hypothetical protein